MHSDFKVYDFTILTPGQSVLHCRSGPVTEAALSSHTLANAGPMSSDLMGFGYPRHYGHRLSSETDPGLKSARRQERGKGGFRYYELLLLLSHPQEQ